MPPKRKSDGKSEPTLKSKVMAITKNVENGVVCNIDSECNYKQTTLNSHNFSRHVASRHPEIFNIMELGDPIPQEVIDKHRSKTTAQANSDDDIAWVKVSKQKTLGGLVKLTTKHGLAFLAMNWDGLRDLVDHQLKPFDLHINNRNIIEHVKKVRAEIDKEIQSESRNEMLSIQFDTTTKQYRSVIGVNYQLYVGNKLVKRTMGMIEMNERHTAENLKIKIEEIYRSFGIQPWQIYSATVDNARNVVAAVREMAETQREERSTEIEEMIKAEGISESDEMSDEDAIAKVEELSDLISTHEVACVRCGAHTFNLVATDQTKDKDVAEELSKIISVVKAYRKSNYSEAFKLQKQKYPPIPNATRWNANHKVMETLREGRNFFEVIATNNPELDLSQRWAFIDEYYEAFRPLYDSLTRVQALTCTLSEFYLEWMNVRGKVIQLSDSNRFKKGILKSMDKRHEVIFKNKAYRAALYMDPRLMYNGSTMFTIAEREEIIAYLASIWTKIDSHKSDSLKTEAAPVNTNCASVDDFDMDKFITEMYGESSSTTESVNSIEHALRNIQYQARQSASDSTFKIIDYWMKYRIQDARIWEIARVVHAAASTQVSVERDNSLFNLVFTSQRHSIGETNLENVLQVKLNDDMINKAIRTAYSKEEKKS